MLRPSVSPALRFGALAALGLLFLSIPASAATFTTVNFTAPCNCVLPGWGNVVEVSGSLTFDGDATGGATFGDADLLGWNVDIGNITFNPSTSFPSDFLTLINTVVIDSALMVQSAGIEFALNGAPLADGAPFWMQLNKTVSTLGVVEFSTFDLSKFDLGLVPVAFPFSKAGPLSFSSAVVIPEPATLGLLALGLAGVAGLRARSGSRT